MRIKVSGAEVRYRVVCEDFTSQLLELAQAEKMVAKVTEAGYCRHIHRIEVDSD